jgi:hypothetical protein
MDKSNKTKLIIFAIVVISAGGYLLTKETAESKDNDIELRMETLKENSKSNKPEQNIQKSLPFRRAPEYNEIYTSARLLTNAANQKAEKEWIEFRLGTRIARENASREKAELEIHQHKLDRLKIVRKIDAIKNGEIIIDDETNQQQQNGNEYSNNPMDQAALIAPKVIAIKDIELLSVHEGSRGLLATLTIGDKMFKNINSTRVVDGYYILDITKNGCVTISSPEDVKQKICIE